MISIVEENFAFEKHQAPIYMKKVGKDDERKPMKKLLIGVLRGAIVFGVVTFISLHVRSDDLFSPDMPDAMDRFGFPFLIYQRGGPVALDYYSSAALWGDFAITLIATGLAMICYARFCRPSEMITAPSLS
jgi:hypothetical protein